MKTQKENYKTLIALENCSILLLLGEIKISLKNLIKTLPQIYLLRFILTRDSKIYYFTLSSVGIEGALDNFIDQIYYKLTEIYEPLGEENEKIKITVEWRSDVNLNLETVQENLKMDLDSDIGEKFKNILLTYQPKLNEEMYPEYTFHSAWNGPHVQTIVKYKGKYAFTILDNINLNLQTVERLCLDWVVNFKITPEGSYVYKDLKKFFKYLRQIEPVKKTKNFNPAFATLDIETFVSNLPGPQNLKKSWEPFAIGVYHQLNTGVENKEEFKSFYLTDYTNQESMFIDCLDYLKLKKIKTIWAHNGGSFDFVLFLGAIQNINKNLEPSSKKIIKITKQLVVENRVYLLKFNYLGFNFSLRDSYLLLPNSLQDLCEGFDLPIKKGVFPHNFSSLKTLNYTGLKPSKLYYAKKDVPLSSSDYDKLPEFFNFKQELLTYLHADCKTLYLILKKFQKFTHDLINVDPLSTYTLPTLANKAWRILDEKSLTNLYTIDQNSNSTNIFENIQKAYFGGICDVYKTHVPEGSYYDINSLYPYIMANTLFPVGKPTYIENTNLDDYFGFCFAYIDTASVASRGLLPFRLSNQVTTPLGKFSGWYYSEELKKVRDLGYKVEVEKGYHWQEKAYLFKNFISTFYDLKTINTSRGNKSLRTIAKLILNSAYGYLGLKLSDLESTLMSPLSSDQVDLSPTNGHELNHPLKNLESTSQIYIQHKLSTKNTQITSNYNRPVNIALAAIIAAEARIYMLKYRLDPRTAYTDTDSIITSGYEPLESMLIDSNTLGAFKKICSFNNFYAFKKKGYTYNTGGKDVIKVSGVPNTCIRPIDIKNLIIKGSPIHLNFNRLETNLQNLDNVSIVEYSWPLTLTSESDSHIKIFNPDSVWVETHPLYVFPDRSCTDFHILTPAKKIKLKKRQKCTSLNLTYSPKTITAQGTEYTIMYPDNFTYSSKWILIKK